MIESILLNANIREGWIICIVGYLIVFIALWLLVFMFNSIPRILAFGEEMKLRRQGKKVETKPENMHMSGDVNAAIATAIYLFYQEVHDEESNVITIKRITKNYSPWSSKIYGLNNTHHKR